MYYRINGGGVGGISSKQVKSRMQQRANVGISSSSSRIVICIFLPFLKEIKGFSKWGQLFVSPAIAQLALLALGVHAPCFAECMKHTNGNYEQQSDPKTNCVISSDGLIAIPLAV